MRSNLSSRTGIMATALALATSVTAAGSASAADGDVVATLLGSWGGSGRIHYTDGSSQSISCSGHYTGGGSELRMAIQCKSDSTPIHIRSHLKVSGGRATGEWEERTYNASGNASGKAGSGSMSLGLSGGGFSGSMSVSFSKSHQNISISTQGIGMSKASMSLNRR